MAAEVVLDTLLFVDTNVLLDFYRIRKTDISTKYLEQLEACKDRLIVGSQIEMEYKKNRQRVIVESLNNFTAPDWGKLTVPALVADLKATKMIDKKKKSLFRNTRRLTKKFKLFSVIRHITTLYIKRYSAFSRTIHRSIFPA